MAFNSVYTSAGPDNDVGWKTLAEIFIILVPVSGGGEGVYALTTGLLSGSSVTFSLRLV